MGLFDRLATVLGLRKRECNVLVVGLDNSGKSTVLNHFKPEEHKHSEIVPTVGFNVERFKSRTDPFFLVDVVLVQHPVVVQFIGTFFLVVEWFRRWLSHVISGTAQLCKKKSFLSHQCRTKKHLFA